MIIRSANPLCYDCPVCSMRRGQSCDHPERARLAQRAHIESIRERFLLDAQGRVVEAPCNCALPRGRHLNECQAMRQQGRIA